MENVRVKGNLTPGFINNKLSPFLDALTGIQHTINEIKREPNSPVKIHEISWEGGSDDKENWIDQSGKTISLDTAKQALSGLREALEALYEQPNNLLLQRAKARAVSRYTTFIYETVLQKYLERESTGYDLIRRRVSPIFLDPDFIYFDTLGELDSLEDKKKEISHIVALLKGGEND